jgi:hypothetical protein
MLSIGTTPLLSHAILLAYFRPTLSPSVALEGARSVGASLPG